MTWTPTITNCDTYLGSRTGKYEWRAVRYRATLDTMRNEGLDDSHTIVDIGAGWTEFDYCARAEYHFKGRYIPIDGGIDGTDINLWNPPRPADWFVTLEILEHLDDPFALLDKIKFMAKKGVIVSTPNPETTDVLGMDETHVTPVYKADLERFGFYVETRAFYGQPQDSLFGVFVK